MLPVVSPLAPLQGAQILLGAVCIGLGVILSLASSPVYTYDYYYYSYALDKGVPFWMGSLVSSGDEPPGSQLPPQVRSI